MEHIVIVGNGVAGITAARHIRKLSDHRITVISVESDHFYSRTALMYIYMGHMTYANTKPYEDWFWEKNRIDLVRGYVETVDTDARKLLLAGGEEMGYDRLIIATGSTTNTGGASTDCGASLLPSGIGTRLLVCATAGTKPTSATIAGAATSAA